MPAKTRTDPDIQDTPPPNPNGSSPTATFADLIGKPPRTMNFPITLSDGENNAVQRRMVYRALPSKVYDDLVAAHPPTPRQLSDANGSGVSYNLDTFAPALIAACSYEPKLSYEQAEQLYHAPEWSGGEISTLFWNAQRVCNSGLDVPFNERG
jgi:hypothetical protein